MELTLAETVKLIESAPSIVLLYFLVKQFEKQNSLLLEIRLAVAELLKSRE